MQKRKVPKELQVGLLTIVVIALIIIGLSYLKGYSILATTNSFYAEFEDVKGLKPGDQVLIQGHQIGQVSEIFFNNKTHKVVVHFWINNDIKVPKDTKVEIFAKDLLGTMAIKLMLGNSKQLAESGDTLTGTLQTPMTEEIKNNLLPIKNKLDTILTQLQTTINGINAILGDPKTTAQWKYNISQILNNSKNLTKNSNELIVKLKQTTNNINSILTDNRENFKKLSTNLTNITDKTNKMLPSIHSSIDTLQQTLIKLNTLLDSLNRGQGTAAKFVNDPRIYDDLDKTINSLNALLVELKEHPERFVHFSVFGRKEKKKKKRK